MWSGELGKTVHFVRACLPLQGPQPTALCNSAWPSSACSPWPQFGFQEPGTNEEIKKFAADRGFTGGRHGRVGLESDAFGTGFKCGPTGQWSRWQRLQLHVWALCPPPGGPDPLYLPLALSPLPACLA